MTPDLPQAKFEDGLPSEIVSKVHLVDLAGRSVVLFNMYY